MGRCTEPYLQFHEVLLLLSWRLPSGHQAHPTIEVGLLSVLPQLITLVTHSSGSVYRFILKSHFCFHLLDEQLRD